MPVTLCRIICQRASVELHYKHEAPQIFVLMCSNSPNSPKFGEQQPHHCCTRQNHTILCLLQPILPVFEHNSDAPVVNITLQLLL